MAEANFRPMSTIGVVADIKRDGEWIGFLPGEEGYDNV